MEATERDLLLDLERHRVQLEENVSKLRQALKHWRTWEVEYVTLKEEIQLKGSPNSSEMIEIGHTLGGNLVNENEVHELLGRDRQTKRTSAQVIDMISRRVDYVQQNIASVEKQIQAEEEKLNAANVLLEPEPEDEEGLPLTDIQEELDEDGNVISSTLSHPSKSNQSVMDTLQKAGITDLAQTSVTESMSTNSAAPPSTIATVASAGSSKSASAKKSVSFSEDVKETASTDQQSSLKQTGYNEDLAAFTFKPGEKVIEVDENDEEIASYPVLPTNESEEDAVLRRQMLQYQLREVGQVVAEIDLDEPFAEYSEEDTDDEEYESEDEDEDQYGRTTTPVLTEEYKKRMRELEQRLDAQLVENIGPRPDTHDLAEYADDVRKLVVRKEDKGSDQAVPKPNQTTTPKGKPEKKGVRFTEELDISPAVQPIATTDRDTRKKTASKPTMSDTVVERSAAKQQTPEAAPSKPAKISRFKSALVESNPAPTTQTSKPTSTPPNQPQGPPNQTLSSTVVERTPDLASYQVPDKDGLDPALLNREIEVEYHKMRNKMIYQQGGFLPSNDDEDAEEGQLMEERDGKLKKVSRFKAARLKAGGGL